MPLDDSDAPAIISHVESVLPSSMKRMKLSEWTAEVLMRPLRLSCKRRIVRGNTAFSLKHGTMMAIFGHCLLFSDVREITMNVPYANGVN